MTGSASDMHLRSFMGACNRYAPTELNEKKDNINITSVLIADDY